ncbi:hypothetical protein BDV96DRAFT_536822 [Lophiotrema nucula]|uniref:Uncharacterized protein n=1 Tax=Lophiotrema nucula TaxID=690887 RepID=A0A6A5ZU41_9PLEO|nr:hypothetical protein BDV96DRAFT_536822 [Lophiotrema nucula]
MDDLHGEDSDARGYEAKVSRSFKRRRGPQGEPLEGLLTLTRQMETDEEDQFDVDLTILDFLAFRATDLVFEWRASSNPHQSDLPDALVTMTSEWRKVLTHKHSGKRVNDQTSFRSRLLQFALLFTHRFNHEKTWTTKESLNDLRAQNKSRGSYWRRNTAHAPALQQPFDTHNEFPLSDGALAENRNNLASSLDTPHERRRWVTDIEGTPSLHCLLPLFVELTASRADLGDFVPTAEWYDLAGSFMLQAVIEDYLRNGAFGPEPFNTTFAFGCPGTEPIEDETTDVAAMRKLFCDENSPHEQIHGWARIKRQYVNELLPSPESSVTFLQAMESAQQRHSYLAFEANLLEFLKYLHGDLVKPDLVQVEEGRITIHGNELPEPESREMIRRMGL